MKVSAGHVLLLNPYMGITCFCTFIRRFLDESNHRTGLIFVIVSYKRKPKSIENSRTQCL